MSSSMARSELFFCFASRRRHTSCYRDWSSDGCSSDLREGRHGRMRNQRAQEPCEGLMPGFVEMALAAEEDDAMAQQRIANGGHRHGRQIAGQPYTVDF